MSFVLRALLVVGVLTYLASHLDGGRSSATQRVSGTDSPWSAAVQKGLAETVSGSLAQAPAAAGRWNGEPTVLPAALQGAGAQVLDRLMREAADGRIVRTMGVAVSRDTLSSTDRQPAWRGAPGR